MAESVTLHECPGTGVHSGHELIITIRSKVDGMFCPPDLVRRAKRVVVAGEVLKDCIDWPKRHGSVVYPDGTRVR